VGRGRALIRSKYSVGGDRAAAERAIEAFLEALGHPPHSNPELAETPARVADAYLSELLTGYDTDVDSLLAGACCGDPGPDEGIVLVRDIRVQTLCPHHLLPGLGVATVAYLPGQWLLGLGALARLVDAYSRRLALQENIGRQVVDALMSKGKARGAYCRLDIHHTCLSCRGARQVAAIVTTEQTAGEFAAPDTLQHLHHLVTGGTPLP
jgi:GTP cyclohydrolase I